jgi:Flp pilus assembly protein TadG
VPSLATRLTVNRFLASSGGLAAVEFSMIAMPLLMLILAMIQIGVVFLAQNEIETATERSARLLLTGQAQQANYTQAQFASAVCGYLPVLINCANLWVDVETVNSFAAANTSAPTVTFNAGGQVTNAANYSPGGSYTYLVLRVMYPFPVVGLGGFGLANLANGSRLLMSTSVFQVERY